MSAEIEIDVKEISKHLIPQLIRLMEQAERSGMPGALKKKTVIDCMDKFLHEFPVCEGVKVQLQFWGYHLLPSVIDALVRASKNDLGINSTFPCCF